MNPPRALVALCVTGVLAFLPATASAVVEECDHGVNFSNGATTSGVTGTVSCVERESRRPYRTVPLRAGLWHGRATWFNPETGLPERVEEYRDGKREGLWQRYDRDGRLVEENSWRDDRQVGAYRRFDPDGRLRALGWAADRGGRGTRLEYDEQGRLVSLQCGDASHLAADREPCGFAGRSTVVFAPDRHGVQRSAQYLNGKLDGVSREVSGGQVLAERVYVAGELHEERQRFGNELRTTLACDPATRVSERFAWFEDGRRKVRARFDDGRIARLESWWQNGKPRLQATIVDRDRAHVNTFYDTGTPNETYEGRLRRLERSLDAWFEPVGDYRSVTPSGKPLMTGRYERERFIGESNEYDEAGVLRQRVVAEADGSRRLVAFDERGRAREDQAFFPDGSRRTASLDERGVLRDDQSFLPDGSRVQ